jgi:ribosomal protein S18 acetylase RimI-like enzyme
MDDGASAIDANLTDGTPILLRRIRADDAARLREGVAELSPESRYRRFFTFAHRVPEAVISRLTDADPAQHIGWGAIRPDIATLPGIAAAHVIRAETGAAHGELAIAVLDAWHGRGVARLLLSALLADSHAEGVASVDIVVLGSNSDALALFRHVGAETAGFEEGTVRLSLPLDRALAQLGRARACARIIDSISQLEPA